MATRPNPKDVPADFDDLLAASATEPVAEVPVEDIPVSENETPEQKRIRELEAELAKPLPEAVEAPIFDDIAKTPEQIKIEELEAKLAERNAALLERAPERFGTEEGKVILIHVVEDGFTEFGRVWMRGQELRIDQAAYQRTKDRRGHSWVDDLLYDPNKQYEAWHHHYVSPGPFVPRPGEIFTAGGGR